jgi:uncharacterized FlaG/YvyC family protein
VVQEDISATGQFPALGASDFATPYSSSAAAAPTLAPTASTPAASISALSASPPTASRPTASPAAAPTVAPSAAEIQAAVDKANANLASSSRVLSFSVDTATGITIAQIRNSQTGEVVQQIPGADVIHLAQMLAAWSPGKHMMLDLIA